MKTSTPSRNSTGGAASTEYLVSGRIARMPDQRIKVDFRLWDVLTGRQLIGAQYGLQPEDWRRVRHVIAEAILGRLIGRS